MSDVGTARPGNVSWTDLPNEIWTKVLQFLTIEDLVETRKVNRTFYNLILDPFFFRPIFKRNELLYYNKILRTFFIDSIEHTFMRNSSVPYEFCRFLTIRRLEIKYHQVRMPNLVEIRSYYAHTQLAEHIREGRENVISYIFNNLEAEQLFGIVYEMRFAAALRHWRAELQNTEIYSRNMDTVASQISTYVVLHKNRNKESGSYWSNFLSVTEGLMSERSQQL